MLPIVAQLWPRCNPRLDAGTGAAARSGHGSAPSRRLTRPSFAGGRPHRNGGRREGRVQVAPMVACKKHAVVTTGTSRTSGLPCAMALRLIGALPGDRLDCPRMRQCALRALHRHQHRDARTTPFRRAYRTVRRRDQVTLQFDTPTAPRLDVRDDRDTPPSMRRDAMRETQFLEKRK